MPKVGAAPPLPPPTSSFLRSSNNHNPAPLVALPLSLVSSQVSSPTTKQTHTVFLVDFISPEGETDGLPTCLRSFVSLEQIEARQRDTTAFVLVKLFSKPERNNECLHRHFRTGRTEQTSTQDCPFKCQSNKADNNNGDDDIGIIVAK